MWEHLLCRELGVHDAEPDWFDDIALGQLGVTSPHTEAAFRAFNASLPYEQSVRPRNFCSLAHLNATRPRHHRTPLPRRSLRARHQQAHRARMVRPKRPH
jgi:hypothetical protein